ncbi:MAG: hypothetical protein LBG19_04330 [Prevotellaceae bacterium]|jgi:hypothetical protein|nr:hypothetical protein [Prevotellaceae bacterium]
MQKVTKYIIRVLKTIVYFMVIILIILGFIALMSENVTNGDYSLLLKDKGFIRILYFIGFIALFYPYLAYASKKIYLRKDFGEERKYVEELLASAKYYITKEEGNKLYFRPKNKFYRLMRMYEDTVTLTYKGNEIEFEGMRKDTTRLARYIERYAENG